jgi:hypothetical protein
MRQHLIVLACVPALAFADKGTDRHAQLDVKDMVGQVNGFKDAAGKIYVVPKPSAESKGIGDRVDKWTFYGDGKTMYRQRSPTSSQSGDKQSIQLYAPRVRGMYNAVLTVSSDSADLSCRMRDHKHDRLPLTRLTEEETTKLLERAKFFPPFWDRQAWFFGRGESTTYYLVDQLRDELGGAGFRLYIGRKGQMKQIAVTDFAKDSGGTLVVTKTAELKISPNNGPVTWTQGKKTIDITPLEPDANGYLIYRELGVYSQLGTVCEDQ